MSTSAPAEGSAPVPPVDNQPPAAPAAPATPPTAEELTKNIPNLGLADLDSMLDGVNPSTEQAPPVPPPPPPPPPAPTADGTPAPGKPDANEDDPTAEKLGKFRHRARDFKEAEFMVALKTMSADEAYKKVYGQPTPPSTPAAPATPPADGTPPPATPPADPTDARVVEVTGKITAAEAEITRLEAELKKASADMDGEKIAEYTRKLAKQERTIERLQDEKQAVEKELRTAADEAAQKPFRQSLTNARNEAFKQFPTLADKDSADRKEFDAFLQLKQDDPEYDGIFQSPRWPLLMAKEFAEAKGLKKPGDAAGQPAAPAPGPAAPVAPPAPRASSAQVLTPGSGGAATFSATPDGLQKDMGKMKLDQLDALLA